MPYFRSTTEATFSYYPSARESRTGNALTTVSHSSNLTFSEDYRFIFRYDYNDLLLNNYNSSIELGAYFRLWTNLEVNYENIWRAESDGVGLDGFSPAETRAGLIWHDQCWSLGLAYVTEKYMTVRDDGRDYRREHSVELVFALEGLGGSSFGIFSDESTN
jgi:hypothetical protein